VTTGTLSDGNPRRFDREVAKYPADQKQSAVMACLAIAQHEQWARVARGEDEVAGYLGMPPIAVHEVTTFYNMYNQKPSAVTSSTSAPTCPASCAAAKRR
jgi:NADH-quinone oxidoreductase subunit E